MVWMNCSLFNYSPTEGHLTCFQFFTVMNKTTINIQVQVCTQMLMCNLHHDRRFTEPHSGEDGPQNGLIPQDNREN